MKKTLRLAPFFLASVCALLLSVFVVPHFVQAYTAGEIHPVTYGPESQGGNGYSCASGGTYVPKDSTCTFSNGGGTYPCYSGPPSGYYTNPTAYCYGEHDHFFIEGGNNREDIYSDDWYQYSGTASVQNNGGEACIGVPSNRSCDRDTATLYFVCQAGSTDPRCVALQPLTVSCSVSPTSAPIGQSVAWTAAPTGSTGPYTFLWSGTDALNGMTTQNPSVSYNTIGTKTGSVTAYDSAYVPAHDVTTYSPVTADNVSCSGAVSGYSYDYFDKTGSTAATVGQQALYRDINQTDSSAPALPDGYQTMCASVTVTEGKAPKCDPDPSIPCNTYPTMDAVVSWHTGTATSANSADAYDGVETFNPQTGTIPAKGSSATAACTNSVSITGAPQPDLTAANVSLSTAQPPVNTAVTISAIVTNAGNATTGVGFTNLFEINKGSIPSSLATVTALKTDSSPTLLATKTDTTSTSYTFPSAGRWYVRLCADMDVSGNGAIAESNEYNNCTDGSGNWTQVTVIAPDLTAGATTASPTTAPAKTAVSLTADISNIGNQDEAGGFANIFVIGDQNKNPVATTSAPGITGLLRGASKTISGPYTFQNPGTYYVKTCADMHTNGVGSVAESDETNNCGAWSLAAITITALQPDLIAGDVTASPTPVTANTVTTLSGLLTNRGGASTVSGFVNLFEINKGSIPTTLADVDATATYSSTALLALGTKTATASYTFPSAGTWYVRLCSDMNGSGAGSIAESNEDNNCSSGGWKVITVVLPTLPDLTATSLSVPPTADVGAAVPLSGAVLNQGTISTVNSFTDLFEINKGSIPATFADIDAVTTYNSSALAAGAGNTASASYTFPSAGTWYVSLCADMKATGVGSITESIEDNNCTAWAAITVGGSAPGADLTATETTASSTVEAGTPLSFYADVVNVGSTTASNFPNSFEIGDASYNQYGSLIASQNIASLAPGGRQQITGSYTFSEPGTYYIRACADNNTSWIGTVVELIEDNNCGGWPPIAVTVTPSVDLFATCSVSPSSGKIGDTFTWSVDSVSGGNGTYTYLWSGDAPLKDKTGSPVNVQYTTKGDKVGHVKVTSGGLSKTFDCTNGYIPPGTCTGSCCGGSCTHVNPPPTVSCTAAPSDIDLGDSSTVSVSASDADSCTVAGKVATCASGSCTGSKSVTPAQSDLDGSGNASYACSCTGPGSPDDTSGNPTPTTVIANVHVHAPGASISADPVRVPKGSSTVLTWSATDVTSCTVTGPGSIGGLPVSGPATGGDFSTGSPFTATPINSQSTFTITCQPTTGSTVTDSVTVNVLPAFQEF